MLPTTFPTDLLGWWREADFDHTSSKWRDSSSNSNHASIGGSGCTYSLDPPGHGAQRAVTTLTGTSSCSVSFGTLPPTFTICSATRYTGTQKERILQAGSINWLHGAWGLLTRTLSPFLAGLLYAMTPTSVGMLTCAALCPYQAIGVGRQA